MTNLIGSTKEALFSGTLTLQHTIKIQEALSLQLTSKQFEKPIKRSTDGKLFTNRSQNKHSYEMIVKLLQLVPSSVVLLYCSTLYVSTEILISSRKKSN